MARLISECKANFRLTVLRAGRHTITIKQQPMEELTPEQSYRTKLIEAIIYLDKVATETFTEIVNLEMIGEFSEIEFEEGEEIKFQLAHFRNCKDQNVQVLINHLDETKAKISWLINVNDVTEDEFLIDVKYE